jgi:serine protease Do
MIIFLIHHPHLDYRSEQAIHHPLSTIHPMNTRYLIPVFLTTVSALVFTPPAANSARIAHAISSVQVGQIAKRTVVRIESSIGDFGSGVIIGRKQQGDRNIYTVLTAAHVVNRTDRSYKVITPVPVNSETDKKRTIIELQSDKDIKALPQVDLAVVSFESKHIFTVGTIGNSEYAEEGSPIYVAGFPLPGKASSRIALQFTGGMVSSRLEDSDRLANDDKSGYDVSYTCVTRAGMSGGPVMDAAGRIVAIHGRGDRDNQNAESSENTGAVNGEKTGFNLGIPIQTFLKLEDQASQQIGARLDLAPLNYELTDSTATIGTRSAKFNKRVRTRTSAPPILDITKISRRIVD